MLEYDKLMNRAFRQLELKPGDIYESCNYHPVLCMGVDYKQGTIWGVSLINGWYPMSCSLIHCGVRKLSPKQAWQIKMRGPADAEAKESIPAERRWWSPRTEAHTFKVGLKGPRKERAKPSADTELAKKAR
jgi:hypothetical protein